MSKRGADKQLTHDNWDAEDSGGEEAGQFQAAPEKVLRERVIKKARRRVNRADSSGAASSPFAAFSGFSAPTTKPAGGANNPFGFLAASAKSSPTAAKSSPAAEKPSSEAAKTSSPAALPFSPAAKPSSSASEPSTPATMSSPVLTRPPLRTGGSGSSSGSGSAEYHRQLQALNRSMLSWLQTHVEKNPLCILTPVFRDYETHLASIERRFGPASAPTPTSAPASDAAAGSRSAAPAEKAAPASATAGTGFSFGPSAAKSADATSPAKSPGFSFGAGAGKTASPGGGGSSGGTGGFSFGLPPGKAGLGAAAAPAATAGFSFGLSSADKKADTSATSASTAGFSFGFQSAGQGGGAAPATSTEEPEESDEPPAPVVTTVKEDDAVYSKKCKLFYKKDGSFVEKGVGMLYLKPCSDEKFQCLVRADTNLGNILLNIKLSKSIPTQRMGKNNVMMACVPNPPLDPKKTEAHTSPVPLLIRVRTADDADELLQQIDEHKR